MNTELNTERIMSSCVYYKFKISPSYDTVKFDGCAISKKNLKAAIVEQKKFGRNLDCDFVFTNAENKQGELLQ